MIEPESIPMLSPCFFYSDLSFQEVPLPLGPLWSLQSIICSETMAKIRIQEGHLERLQNFNLGVCLNGMCSLLLTNHCWERTNIMYLDGAWRAVSTAG